MEKTFKDIMSEAIKQAVEGFRKKASISAASSGKPASRTADLLIDIVINYLKDKL